MTSVRTMLALRGIASQLGAETTCYLYATTSFDSTATSPDDSDQNSTGTKPHHPSTPTSRILRTLSTDHPSIASQSQESNKISLSPSATRPPRTRGPLRDADAAPTPPPRDSAGTM
ncbi:hypothetical protein BDZ85DRAFT_222759 [Elsinoe ampelina]|uniref:Uncharacterized protein n=1 Tax=Elsinoe ampelina TaxID=302913 RepID=A0A6A6G4E4_9PEZI|nr:hypothetical protein BDZ85DRAFT_222759 [Elsinoe ampelina]